MYWQALISLKFKLDDSRSKVIEWICYGSSFFKKGSVEKGKVEASVWKTEIIPKILKEKRVFLMFLIHSRETHH